jgi:hypothetical protein
MENTMEALINLRTAQLKAKPWFLLNSQIPVGQFSTEEKNAIDLQLEGWKNEGQNLDHVSWKYCGD